MIHAQRTHQPNANINAIPFHTCVWSKYECVCVFFISLGKHHYTLSFRLIVVTDILPVFHLSMHQILGNLIITYDSSWKSHSATLSFVTLTFQTFFPNFFHKLLFCTELEGEHGGRDKKSSTQSVLLSLSLFLLFGVFQSVLLISTRARKHTSIEVWKTAAAAATMAA